MHRVNTADCARRWDTVFHWISQYSWKRAFFCQSPSELCVWRKTSVSERLFFFFSPSSCINSSNTRCYPSLLTFHFPMSSVCHSHSKAITAQYQIYWDIYGCCAVTHLMSNQSGQASKHRLALILHTDLRVVGIGFTWKQSQPVFSQTRW